jgi:hypothetical protein
MSRVTELVDRYIAVWNEPDAAKRHNAVVTLRSEDAVHILDRRRRFAKPQAI